jgi:hypothetical protein
VRGISALTVASRSEKSGRPVVHLVDVVAGEDEDEARPLVLDQARVLADGIGRPLVPAASELQLRGDRVDELVEAGT